MKIRWKLLILLLAIALAPLIVAAVLHHVSIHRLGSRLASGRREILIKAARHHLHHIVDDYGRILDRDRKMLELAVTFQAHEVERRLAEPPPVEPRLFFVEDYDKQENLPEGMALSNRHYRPGPDGKLVPIPVTYRQQVYFVVRGVDRKAVDDDMARLSAMPEVYRLLYRRLPNMMYWQYASLESGFHSCYPGHGGYPPKYDPRKRQWYTETKKSDSLTWLVMPDVSTRSVALTVAMPVHRPNGAFAGVTAIDVPLISVLEELKLPEQWSAGAGTMLVIPDDRPGTEGKLVIIAQRSYESRGLNWEAKLELEFLASDAPQELEALRADALAGVSGVRRMRYRGCDALWAYGAGGQDEPFPVVVVPYDRIVAQAVQAEQYVLARMTRGLKVAGVIMLGVVVVVAAVAFFSSRSVTRPIRQLAEVSRRLAGGDYDTKIHIRTGDELQELGDIVNDIGPKLHERERLRRSLALAMEIQQNLLPRQSPKLEGFDIAGTSVYCDETGGDYYDFIEIVDVSTGQLGIAIGDITGHGIGAALLMASARAVLRSHVPHHAGGLDELFDDINVHLVRDTGEARFLTLFYGLLDAESRTLTYASAGHDPAFWLHSKTGEIEGLGNTGIPLGILQDARYSQKGPLSLESGDLLVLSTDGVREAQNGSGEEFGADGLKRVMRNCAGDPAEAIHERIVQAVREFQAGHVQEDDITLVIIKIA